MINDLKSKKDRFWIWIPSYLSKTCSEEGHSLWSGDQISVA